MILEPSEEVEVQTRMYGHGHGMENWESFRSFDTVEEAIDYANADMNVRIVKRTVVTIKGEWEVVQ